MTFPPNDPREFMKSMVETGTRYEFVDVPTLLGHMENSLGVALSFAAWDALVMDSCACQMIEDYPQVDMNGRLKLKRKTLTGKFGTIHGTVLWVDYEFPTEEIVEENCYYVCGSEP